jgi:hypothetical protein
MKARSHVGERALGIRERLLELRRSRFILSAQIQACGRQTLLTQSESTTHP